MNRFIFKDMSRVFCSIYHISDIHIRLYSRKEEYNFVFENLYKTLREHPKVSESLIVITGDILHNKIDLTPECILMTLNFLKSLGEICPTILIAGNHDALLNNRERLDSLTSILHDRNPKNVYYLKNTGYYKFGNIVFAVNSLLDDDPQNWLHLKNDLLMDPDFFTDSFKIALYHGQITGWKNNFGFISESGEKTQNDFLGYDFVLLGDIHKHQFMNKEKNMAYSGSLISQNFGETDDDHGILFWDLFHNTTEFIQLYNPYSFCEGVLTNDLLQMRFRNKDIEWQKEDALKKNLPPSCNIKIFLTSDIELNHNFIKKFKHELPRAKMQSKYELKQIKDSTNVTTSIHDNQDSMLNDILWIRTFIHEKLEGNDIIIVEKIIDALLEEYRKNLSLSTIVNNPCWELRYLKFDNMFGYGKNNVIDFEKLYPYTITGIFGKNSYGKSTIIDIITFLLFGKITRSNHGNSIPKEIINIHENSSYGEIIFKVGNEEYKITKTCTRQKNDKLKVNEILSLRSDNEWKNYSEEHRKKTDKIIDNLLGNMESFLFTNVCLQQRDKQFREMTQKDRKEFLYSIFGLDWFEKYRKEQEDEYKKLKGEEKVYKEKIGDSYALQWEHSFKELYNNISTIEEEISQINTKLEKLNNKKISLSEQFKKCPFANENQIHSHLKTKQNDLDLIVQREKDLLCEKELILKKKNNLQIIELKKELENINKILIEFQDYKELLESDHSEIKKWVHCDRHEWETFYKEIGDYIENSEKITREWTLEKNNIESEIQKIKDETVHYDKKFVIVNEFENLKSKITKIQEEIPILESKLLENIKELPLEIDENFEKFNDNLHKYEMNECAIKLLRNNLKETKNIKFNTECDSCMNNPFYLKMNQMQEDLHIKEKNSKQLMINLREIFSLLQNFIPDLDADFTIQNSKEDISRKIAILKRNREDQLRKKDMYIKKLESHKLLLQKYNHTKNFLYNEDLKVKLSRLENSLRNNVHKNTYEKLIFYLKNLKLYQNIQQFWVHFNKEYTFSYLEMKQKQLQDQCFEFDNIDNQIDIINEGILDCSQKKIKLNIEISQCNEHYDIFNENKKLQEQRHDIDKKLEKYNLLKNEKSKLLNKMQIEYGSIKEKKKEWENNMTNWKSIQEEMKIRELLIKCIDRDGLPLFLLKMLLPMIESEVNQLIYTFLERKISLKVGEKDVIIGLESKNLVSNYLGGMESFIVDLSLKLVFSKFSKQPRSNFFIIDEGISVFDQERISNIGLLFNFLSSISEHIFLISHLPTIKDYVTQSIDVFKDENSKSYLVFN